MLFNSFVFLIFSFIVIPLFFLLPHKHRWKLLLVASCFFYMYLIPIYILVLFAVITIDFFAAIEIEKATANRKKVFLLVSLLGNLGILLFFKYYNFFTDNVNEVTALFPFIKTRLTHLNIILPIGLSFHTFQAISYIIEVYRGKQKPEKSYGIYALYVMFFPQLVAGPIERPQNVLHQFHEEKKFSYNNFFSGLRYILWGLFMKSVIADRLAIHVDEVYNNTAGWSGLCVIVATVFFAIQIYCDFAGYSYMAFGIARLMGFDLMVNFRQPYFAKNISEFWSKWHISLSTWFRDYVYIPLGGNRVGQLRLFFNILVVFSLSGLWHGSSWNFLVWGLFHCVLIISYFLLDKYLPQIRLPKSVAMIFTFFLVCLGWIFFRVKNMQDGAQLFSSIFHFSKNYFQLSVSNDIHGLPPTYLGLAFWKFSLTLCIIPIFFCLEYLIISNKIIKLHQSPQFVKWSVYYAAILAILFLGVFDTRQFIYFQF